MDNGSQFKGKPFQDLLKSYEIQLGYIANYHAQANPVERTHRVVKTILSAYVQENHRSWEKYLQKYSDGDLNFLELKLFRRCSQTKFGARDGNSLHCAEKDVYKRLQRASVSSSARYNLRRRDERFTIGQKVFKKKYTLSNKAKGLSATLNHKFEGPFTVTRIVSPWSYELKDSSNRSIGVWHASDLKAHPPDSLD
nr:unnamed protein product [Callosobruchus analis]